MAHIQETLPGASITGDVSVDNYDVMTPSHKYRSESPAESEALYPDWDYQIKRERETDNIMGVLAHSPDTTTQARITYRDTLYRKTLYRQSVMHDGELCNQYQWRRFFIGDIRYTESGTLVADVVNGKTLRNSRQDIRNGDLDARAGEWKTTLPIAYLAEEIANPDYLPLGEEKFNRWNKVSPTQFSPDDYPRGTTFDMIYEPIAPGTSREPVTSTSDLEFEVVTGTGSLTLLNHLLEGGDDGLIEHVLGSVTFMKAGFVAREAETGEPVSVAVLERHPNPTIAKSGDVIYLSRLANHPTRPQNTSSWMLARICDWAKENGWNELVATAGVGNNYGTCYKATGFELDEQRTGWADGGGWQNRSGRQAYHEGNSWYRRRWVKEL